MKKNMNVSHSLNASLRARPELGQLFDLPSRERGDFASGRIVRKARSASNLLTSTAVMSVCYLALLHPTSAHAQQSQVSFDGNTGPLTLQQRGSDAPYWGGAGQPGPAGQGTEGYAITPQTNKDVTLSTAGPALVVSSIGGRGGIAGTGDGLTGGAGGNAGPISLIENTGIYKAYYYTNTGAGDLISLLTQGGNGAEGSTPGNRGNGGLGGAAGLAGAVNVSLGLQSYVGLNVTNGNAISISTHGGNGGQAGQTLTNGSSGTATTGAVGANGGAINLDFGGDIRTVGTGATTGGLNATSYGGAGGQGGEGSSTWGSASGGTGGQGGAGGIIVSGLREYGSIVVNSAGDPASVIIDKDGNAVNIIQGTAGIKLASVGGVGGISGSADAATSGTAGNGGRAGDGGAITLNLHSHGTALSAPKVGVAVRTTGALALGALALSVGGAGGDSSDAGGGFARHGGNGGSGGNGGAVTVDFDPSLTWQHPYDYTQISTAGEGADGIVALSVGGGGGVGGSISGGSVGYAAATGGRGGNGGDGGPVSVSVKGQAVISTTGSNSLGILAQSIGGGGGRGGDARSIGLGTVVNLQIGGTPDSQGGDGGAGGNSNGANPQCDDVDDLSCRSVDVTNYGIVQTTNHHSGGILAQAIGGGGGTGGGAVSVTIGSGITQSFAVGGSGGAGGNGGVAVVSNIGQVNTAGSNSHAIHVQSIGGGGGNGGSALAMSIPIDAPDEPSLTTTTAIGGSGGGGGDGDTAKLINSGMAVTTGPGAFALFAQSIGGGGGDGGDSSATATAYTQSKLTITQSIGGSGGSGGNGSEVHVANSGLAMTMGNDSHGVVAQSIGGGGGNGGPASLNQGAYKAPGNYSANLNLAIGGQGGKGGNGGAVRIDNFISDDNVANQSTLYPGASLNGLGGIVTMGTSSAGIFAQSIGGGGGSAGSATSQGGNGQVSINVAIGGNGGVGGTGGSVNIVNPGSIATFGADSFGIFAQSVGGGGGKGGNATTGAGNDPQYSYPQFLANQMSSTLNSAVQPVTDLIWDWKDNRAGVWSNIKTIRSIYESYQGANPPSTPFGTGESGLTIANLTVDLGAGFAGNGGAAGDGSTVDLANSGSILTRGPGSIAIFGQSVGGGGGVGGASAASTANDKLPVAVLQGAVSLGGRGGKGGQGGEVLLGNLGDIQTFGDLSHGMFAQSIGGGGGFGGASTTVTGRSVLSLKLGAGSGTSGNGGFASVENSASIITYGNDAIGMVAQSVGGGGGYGALTGQVIDPQTGSGFSRSQTTGGNAKLQIMNTGQGDGGDVSAFLTVDSGSGKGGSILTNGINSYGILAQSVGGGGGIFIVNSDTTISSAACGTDGNGNPGPGLYYTQCLNISQPRSDGGHVYVKLDPGTSIRTNGNGAAGIFAQSIGGAGAIINGLNGINLNPGVTNNWGYSGTSDNERGNAGQVNVESNGIIETYGQFAHGIFAQAASSGGGTIGRFDSAGNATGIYYLGFTTLDATTKTVNGVTTTSNEILINLHGNSLTAVSGAFSYGVVALSLSAYPDLNSKATSNVYINMDPGAQIIAKDQAAGAVLFGGATGATIFNAGTIDASQSKNDYAVVAIHSPFGDDNNYTIYNYAGSVLKGQIANRINALTGTAALAAVKAQGIDLENRAGATFEMGASVDLGGGTLINGGTLRVGYGTAVAKTAIVGNFIQQAGGTLHLDTDFAASTADKVEVSGKAVLGGTIHVTPSKVSNKTMTVLTAAGGITLDPQIKQTDASALFDFPVKASGNLLTISAKANFTQAAVGLGTKQKAVAGHLQKLFDGGVNMDDGFTVLATLNDAGAVAKALDTLGGHALGAIGTFRYAASRAFVANMTAGCDVSVTGDGTQCVWAKVQALSANQDATRDQLGYKANAQAYQLGVAREVGSDIKVGFSAAFEEGNFSDVEQTARIDGETLMLGASLGWHHGGLGISGALEAGYGWYKSDRIVGVGPSSERARSKPTAWQMGMHLQASYVQPVGKVASLTPFADVHGMYVRSRRFVESGASPFDLDVAGKGDFALTGTLGVELGGKFSLAGGALKPFVRGAAEFNSDANWTTSARFAEQSSTDRFSVTTASPGTIARIGVGGALISSKNADLTVSYNRGWGRNYEDKSVVGRLTVRF